VTPKQAMTATRITVTHHGCVRSAGEAGGARRWAASSTSGGTRSVRLARPALAGPNWFGPSSLAGGYRFERPWRGERQDRSVSRRFARTCARAARRTTDGRNVPPAATRAARMGTTRPSDFCPPGTALAGGTPGVPASAGRRGGKPAT
jgi:hypothetical protein